LGKQVQQIIQAAKAGDWSENGGVVTAGGVDLVEGEYELTLETGEGSEGARALALLPAGGFVLLDTVTTVELEAEGLARDVIRAVQDTRKAAGFDVSDRIHLNVFCFSQVDAEALKMNTAADIAADTLATEFGVHDPAFHAELAGFAETSPAEWLPGLLSIAPEHFAVIPAGQYANEGNFVVAVSRVNRVVNV
jgi:isoleucyl-tRNA synthetase